MHSSSGSIQKPLKHISANTSIGSTLCTIMDDGLESQDILADMVSDLALNKGKKQISSTATLSAQSTTSLSGDSKYLKKGTKSISNLGECAKSSKLLTDIKEQRNGEGGSSNTRKLFKSAKSTVSAYALNIQTKLSGKGKSSSTLTSAYSGSIESTTSPSNASPLAGTPDKLFRERTGSVQLPGSSQLKQLEANPINSRLLAHKRNLSAQEFRKFQPKTINYRLEDYNIIRKIGSGGFAQVYLVKLKVASGGYYALKAITKKSIKELDLRTQLVNERAVHLPIRHNFVVELVQIFQTPAHVFFVLEYAACGDLYKALHQVKPENILLDANGHIKVADFGLAKRLERKTNSLCGTPDYVAPEILQEQFYTYQPDWWGVGVLAFELMVGKTPFYATSIQNTYKNILSGKIPWTADISPAAKTVISKFLDPDMSFRLCCRHGITELEGQEWFKDISWMVVKNRGLKPPFIPNITKPEALEEMMKSTTQDSRKIYDEENQTKMADITFE
ncbi:camp-dependent protein kinase catalytic subunit [Boothiomyces macroporosus]|uniref:cAMP-dependent protein kinase n=1 Tax=Boothiomyces macroporosus TaxID=261099 RepID=A0AAD5Y4N1_9FUNG|nr:camp-dependent protein kinase catalytic subunit [Boothiomyces macroporosus]